MKSQIFNFPGSNEFKLYTRPIIDPNGNLGLKWDKLYWHCGASEDQLIPSSLPSQLELVESELQSSVISVPEMIFLTEIMLGDIKQFNSDVFDVNFKVPLLCRDEKKDVYLHLEGFMRGYFTFPWQACSMSRLSGGRNTSIHFRRVS